MKYDFLSILADFPVNTKTQVAGLINRIGQFGFLYLYSDMNKHLFEWFRVKFGKKSILWTPPTSGKKRIMLTPEEFGCNLKKLLGKKKERSIITLTDFQKALNS